eukprot:6180650-Pleurochrysis_carterae.AAC.3
MRARSKSIFETVVGAVARSFASSKPFGDVCCSLRVEALVEKDGAEIHATMRNARARAVLKKYRSSQSQFDHVCAASATCVE